MQFSPTGSPGTLVFMPLHCSLCYNGWIRFCIVYSVFIMYQTYFFHLTRILNILWWN